MGPRPAARIAASRKTEMRREKVVASASIIGTSMATLVPGLEPPCDEAHAQGADAGRAS